jgi:hypothetical protein
VDKFDTVAPFIVECVIIIITSPLCARDVSMVLVHCEYIVLNIITIQWRRLAERPNTN